MFVHGTIEPTVTALQAIENRGIGYAVRDWNGIATLSPTSKKGGQDALQYIFSSERSGPKELHLKLNSPKPKIRRAAMLPAKT
jgi:hypothetical protein